MGRPVHHCGRCGTDLTRVRAVRDPIYALPLVRCPACGMTVARWKHPLPLWKHRVCRAIPAILVLLVQAILAPIVTVVFLVLSALMAEEIMIVGFRRDGRVQADVLGAFIERYATQPWELGTPIAMLCVAAVAGAWIGGLMRHCRRWVVMAGWLAFVLGYVGLDTLRASVSWMKWFFQPLLGDPWAQTPLHSALWAIVVVALFPVVLAATLAAGGVARAMSRRRAERRKRYMARRRSARTPGRWRAS